MKADVHSCSSEALSFLFSSCASYHIILNSLFCVQCHNTHTEAPSAEERCGDAVEAPVRVWSRCRLPELFTGVARGPLLTVHQVCWVQGLSGSLRVQYLNIKTCLEFKNKEKGKEERSDAFNQNFPQTKTQGAFPPVSDPVISRNLNPFLLTRTVQTANSITLLWKTHRFTRVLTRNCLNASRPK